MLSRGRRVLGEGEDVERPARLERLASEFTPPTPTLMPIPIPTPSVEDGLGSAKVFSEISGREA